MIDETLCEDRRAGIEELQQRAVAAEDLAEEKDGLQPDIPAQFGIGMVVGK